MAQSRKMPYHPLVWKNWRETYAGDTPFRCFACDFDTGGRYNLHRAHITPRCEGGSDSVGNLHLLCGFCHKRSEFLSGDEYYNWLDDGRSLVNAVRQSFNLQEVYEDWELNPEKYDRLPHRLSVTYGVIEQHLTSVYPNRMAAQQAQSRYPFDGWTRLRVTPVID